MKIIKISTIKTATEQTEQTEQSKQSKQSKQSETASTATTENVKRFVADAITQGKQFHDQDNPYPYALGILSKSIEILLEDIERALTYGDRISPTSKAIGAHSIINQIVALRLSRSLEENNKIEDIDIDVDEDVEFDTVENLR